MEKSFDANKVSVSVRDIDVDTSIVKISIIGVLGVILSVTGSYFLKIAFNSPTLLNTAYATAAISGFLMMLLYQSLFIKSNGINWWIVLIESIGLVSFFVIPDFKFYWGLVISWFCLAIIMQLAASSGINELSNQLRIKFTTIAKKVIPPTVGGIAIFVSIIFANNLYYSKGQITTPDQIKVILSSIIEPSLVKSIPTSPTSKDIKENISKAKISEIIWSSILPTLTTQFTQEQIDLAKKDLINGTFKPIQDQAKIFGITIQQEDTVEKVISTASKSFSDRLNQKYSELSDLTKILIIISFAFLLFITIKLTATIIYLVIYPLAFIIFEILLALNFAKINFSTQSKETVNL